MRLGPGEVKARAGCLGTGAEKRWQAASSGLGKGLSRSGVQRTGLNTVASLLNQQTFPEQLLWARRGGTQLKWVWFVPPWSEQESRSGGRGHPHQGDWRDRWGFVTGTGFWLCPVGCGEY